jgi:hypothetical protein
MALLERVGTLLRANLNDLIDRAEDPEKMVKQVILDMENQLMQVKTQVAISIADLHLLQKKPNWPLRRGMTRLRGLPSNVRLMQRSGWRVSNSRWPIKRFRSRT